MHQPVSYTTIELKYCEACGGLLLRAAGAGTIYCPRCAPRMAQMAHSLSKFPPQPALNDSGEVIAVVGGQQ
jgi:hypothetical protein